MTSQALATAEQISRLVTRHWPDATVVRTWPVTGGVSSQVTGIETARTDGRRQKLVLRQYGEANLRTDPHTAEHEFRLLRLLSAAGLPVPWPYLADESAAIVPGPCLLQDFVDGERCHDPAAVPDFTGQLAAALAALHDADIARAEISFLADVGDDVEHWLEKGRHAANEFVHETAIRATLTDNWPPPPVNQPVLLHGDYWPGNVLWRDGTLAAVIDWEDALFGDPLADLSITRLELRWCGGAAAADQFTREYLALRPGLDVTTLPLWDLRAALRACQFNLESWGLEPDQLAAMRERQRDFGAAALAQLRTPAN